MEKSIDTNLLGELPARYSFVLNPYADVVLAEALYSND